MSIKSNKYDTNSGIGKSLNLFEQKIYSIVPNIRGEFVDENSVCIAKRVTLDLTQNSSYPTQFYNKQLAYAIKNINSYTKPIYYNENGEITNTFSFRPEISPDYASVICQAEPDYPLIQVSVVIYCGPEVNTLLLKDGSVTMDSTYSPSEDTDIVTKKYADSLVEGFTAVAYPLESFSIVQGDHFAPIAARCYLDNSIYENVLFIENYQNTSSVDICKLTVDAFIVPLTYAEETVQLELLINGSSSHVDTIQDIIAGKSSYWILETSENVFNDNSISQVFWKNSYNLTFNPRKFLNYYTAKTPYIDVCIKIRDNVGRTRNSKEYRFGFESYISTAISNVTISFIEETFNSFKTKYISGHRYFPVSEEVYNLPITLEIKNSFLNYFRPETCLKLSVVDDLDEELNSQILNIDSHQPVKGMFTFNLPIEFSTRYNILKLQAFNVKEEIVFEYSYKFDTESDVSDESNRVTTPSAAEIFPATGYGETWDSLRKLEKWEMKLKDNFYTSDDVKNSAVCFVVNPASCYSHLNIDIEHDGYMYILSEGNTEWLDCQKQTNAFVNPIKNGQGCKVNDNLLSFGRVVYSSKVFVRVINATFLKLNFIALN